MKYNPNPIDTSDIVLSKQIHNVAGILAKNTHETWAKKKLQDGFIYGKVTDSEKKTHNCLVPFEQLSEEERSYDIDTALEAIKLLIKMGFHIEADADNTPLTENGFGG